MTTVQSDELRPVRPWCQAKAYLDVHTHAASTPTFYANSAEFFAELDAIQVDAEANNGSANVIVNLDSARWFSELAPNPYDRIVLTGIVRPQARNHGQSSSGGHYYPAGSVASGDPLSHIKLFADYGVKAIKLLAKHNSHTGIEADPSGDIWVGHCGDWDTGDPQTLVGGSPSAHYQVIAQSQVGTGPARTYCADYDDDAVRLGYNEGAGPSTFFDYFREAARHNLSVMVHGEERFFNERTGTNLMGHESLVRALQALRSDTSIPLRQRASFAVLMLHGPATPTGLSNDPAVIDRFVATPGLFWETGGRGVLNQAINPRGVPYKDASARDRQRRRTALADHLAGDGGLGALASRMMFGVDGRPGLTPGLSSNGYQLVYDTLSASDSPATGEDLDETFCERAARFLRL